MQKNCMPSEASQKKCYEQHYEEHNLLGRGAYGSAYLVKNRLEDAQYVAKKMHLEGMTEKDKLAAWREIQILQKFKQMSIPFIVEYKECFNFQNMLIIIMEYCEHGDLQTFLKNWKKKGEPINEKIIVNWFVQLLIGVKALHSKKVLHRDLKSANVFITSNKTLKIGDFGISKVLDNTSAKTFVGTPYYLSPQVCQNRPYSLASDVWALGCILYEMCSLTYPFQGNNLIGLAVKIVNEEVKPISQKYSSQLNSIVMKLFIKNQKKRITIDEIIRLPFIQKHMTEFAKDQEQINKLIVIGKKHIKHQQQEDQERPKNRNSIKQSNQTKDENEDTWKTINTVMQKTGVKQSTLAYSQSLTPGQRMKLNKQQQVLKKQQQAKQAVLKSAATQNFAKQKKMQNLSTSGSGFGYKISQTPDISQMPNKSQSIQMQKQIQYENKQKAEAKFIKKRLQKMQVINTEELCQSLNQIMTKKAYNPLYEQNNDQQIKTITNSFKYSYIDDRPIKPSKNLQYQIDQEKNNYQEIHEDDEELDEYYDDEFEDYIEDQEDNFGMKSTIKKKNQDIKAFYDELIGNRIISPTKKSKVAQVFKAEQINVPANFEKRIFLKIQKCKQMIGQKRYNQLKKKVQSNQINYKTIKSQYSPEQINAIQIIEQIVFEEGNK